MLVFELIGGQDGINFVLPFFMFIFIMALGQDYNILVMTRIREEAHHAPIRVAVRRAVEATGTTVTSAGLILAGTFGVLTATGGTQVQEIGLGLAAGILLDTFFVRTLLVPSVVVLLGRWNWWPSKLSHEDHSHDPVFPDRRPGRTRGTRGIRWSRRHGWPRGPGPVPRRGRTRAARPTAGRGGVGWLRLTGPAYDTVVEGPDTRGRRSRDRASGRCRRGGVPPAREYGERAWPAERTLLVLPPWSSWSATERRRPPARCSRAGAGGLHLSDEGVAQAEAVAARIAALAGRTGPDPWPSTPRPSSGRPRRPSPSPGSSASGSAPNGGSSSATSAQWTGARLADPGQEARVEPVQRCPSGFRFPGGESFLEMQARITSAIGRLVQLHPGQTIVAVSHADPIKAAVAAAAGTPLDLFQRLNVSPCSVSALAYSPAGPHVLAVNSTGALGELAIS